MAANCLPLEARWRGLERIVVHVLGQWRAQPRHSNPVFERDGWRCAVPACSSRRELQDHHIVFRSRGGNNDRSNRISICAWHHLHGIHAGRIELRGRAPHHLLWRLGISTGSALLALRGDAYLSGAPEAVA